ncbi:hypothetical protein SK128_011207, partial [Halocaridina rubra]
MTFYPLNPGRSFHRREWWHPDRQRGLYVFVGIILEDELMAEEMVQKVKARWYGEARCSDDGVISRVTSCASQ